MQEFKNITHTFEPVFDENSKILILGTFPSVKSRENHFYYGHPQNRFWKVMAAVMDSTQPQTIEEKKNFLLENHIAVWDVIHSCSIEGSSDSSIPLSPFCCCLSNSVQLPRLSATPFKEFQKSFCKIFVPCVAP